MQLTPEDACRLAIKEAGGAAAVARHLEISKVAVHLWKRVPAERVRALEALCGRAVTRYELRPDIYGEK